MITSRLLPHVMSKSLALRVRCALYRATAADDLVVAEAPLLEALRQSATTDHRRLSRLIATLGTDERPQRLPTFRFLCEWAFLADASLSGVIAMSAGLLLWVEEALMGSAASVEFFDLFDETPDVWQGGHAIDVLSVSPPLITPRAFAWRPPTESIQRRHTEETPLEVWRLCQIELLRELAFDWIFLHEAAHLFDGHLGLYADLLSLGGRRRARLGMSDSPRDATDPMWRNRVLPRLAAVTTAYGKRPLLYDLRRAFELQADHLAFAFLHRLHSLPGGDTAFDRYEARLRKYAPDLAQPLATMDDGRRVRAMLTAAGVVILLIDRLVLWDGRPAGYPSPQTRFCNLQLAALAVSDFTEVREDGMSLPPSAAEDPRFAPYLRSALFRPSIDLEVVARYLGLPEGMTPTLADGSSAPIGSKVRDFVVWCEAGGRPIRNLRRRTFETAQTKELSRLIDKINALRDLCRPFRTYGPRIGRR